MAKDTEKLIRQLSLISYLMAERRPVTATEIRRDVEGYSDMTEDAFARRFYADRAELDALGIHLRVDKPADGFSEQENYSLAPEAFHLPAIAFSDAERAALQTALTLLDGEFAYAEPLRLALQQITWGRPSPLGTDSRQTIGLGITASAGGSELSAPPGQGRHRDLPPQADRVRVLHDAVAATTALRKVDPYHLLFEGGQWYLVGYSHERDAVRVFRLSRIRGKVAYSTKAEHDFQRPADFDPRGYANRIPWQLGDPVGTGEVWVSEKIAWYVERQFGAYGDDVRRRGRRAHLPHRATRSRACSSRGRCASAKDARSLGPPELVDEVRARDRPASSSATAASRSPRSPTARPPAAAGGRARGRRPLARRPRPASGPSASPGWSRSPPVLIAAGRERPPAPGRRGLRAAADLRAGAARGRLRAQRRQLRRRRLRDLRRGAAVRRDRGRPRAVLGHLRPPGPAAADRGQRARRGDRPDRRALRPGRARLRARQDRRGARARPGRGGPARHLADRRGRDHARSSRRRCTSRAGCRSNTGRPTRTSSRTGRSSRTRSSTARRRGTSPPWTRPRRTAAPLPAGPDQERRRCSTRPSSAARTSTRWPTSRLAAHRQGRAARASRTCGSRPSRRAGRARSAPCWPSSPTAR